MFARDPDAGPVKTRLAPALSREGAAALYRAFTADLCATLAPRFELVLACTPSADAPHFRRLARRFRVSLVEQGGGDLGARMRRIASDVLTRAARVVLVGSDAPTLPVAYVEDAFAALRRHAVAIAPSLDGGYCLLGMRARRDDLFGRMPWGTARVFQLTLRRLRRARVRPYVLPCWYDVDAPADLAVLRRDLAIRAAIGDAPSPRTARVLHRLDAAASRAPGARRRVTGTLTAHTRGARQR